MLWQVTNSLRSYGNKLDHFQTAIMSMRSELESRQSALATNQSRLELEFLAHSKQLVSVEKKTQDAQSHLVIQQSNLLVQVKELHDLQGKVVAAQTNLIAQQKKLENVEYWVENLFERSNEEEFSLNDTNKVLVLAETNHVVAIVALSHIPLHNSIRCRIIN